MRNFQTPILILHGWGSSEKNWHFVREYLEAKGYRVYIPDLPGFGSNPAPNRPWSAEDYAEWIHQWTEKQNLSKFYLAGHSFGGGVAAVFAAKYPKKVMKLILIASAIIRHKTLKQSIFRFVGKIGNLIFLVPFLRPFRSLAQRFLYKIIGVQDYRRLAKNLNASVMKESFRKIIREDLCCYLSKVTAPALVVWGDKDRVTQLEQAEIISQKIPNCSVKVFKGKGHPLNLEAPKELAEAIINFLDLE